MPLSHIHHPETHLFFGRDARPIAEVVSRRHPFAFAMYAVVFLLGLVFVFHWYTGGVKESTLLPGVSEWAIFAWKWMMVTGGGLALVFLTLNPRPAPHWPDISDLLHLEGIAAIVAAFGVSVYLVVIVHLSGVHDSAPAVTIYGVIIVSHLVRATQAIHDAKQLQRLSQLADDANGVSQ
jgi:hypothetical protein